jgi:hypothetical protein
MVEDTKTGEPSENISNGHEQAAPPSHDKDTPVNYRPFWDRWRCCRFFPVDLDEAVALSCNFETDVVENWGLFGLDDEDLDEFHVRLDIAKRAAASRSAFDVVPVPEKDGTETIKVLRLYDFVNWALKMRQQQLKLWETLPDEFVELAGEAPPSTWPWRTKYTTPLLEELKAAVEKFWKDCDPDVRPEKIPSTEEVVYFLQKERTAGTLPTSAKAIDKVIRHKLCKSGTYKDKKSAANSAGKTKI